MRNLILAVLMATITSVSLPLEAASSVTQRQQEASHLYQAGDYKNAYAKYQKLVKDAGISAQ